MSREIPKETAQRLAGDFIKVMDRLVQLYEPAPALLYITLPHKLLDNDTALFRIMSGDAESVLRVIESIETGAYV